VSGTVRSAAPRQGSISDGHFKLIHYLEGGHEVELYDLHGDPAEQANLAAAMPEIVKEGLRLLDASWRRMEPAADEPAVAMSPATQMQLRALGYLE